MKIAIASDHAGFELKNKLVEILKSRGQDVVDCGPDSFDPNDDYPDFIGKASEMVSSDSTITGIILGGTGQGEQITANKYVGVRCALFYGPIRPNSEVDISGRKSDDPYEIIKLAREHNDANMLSIAVRFVNEDEAVKAIELFLNTPFSHDERHVRRIEKIRDIENGR
jgi:ribose 5-phosphate isomerase B